jgi:hypothetical protein
LQVFLMGCDDEDREGRLAPAKARACAGECRDSSSTLLPVFLVKTQEATDGQNLGWRYVQRTEAKPAVVVVSERSGGRRSVPTTDLSPLPPRRVSVLHRVLSTGKRAAVGLKVVGAEIGGRSAANAVPGPPTRRTRTSVRRGAARRNYAEARSAGCSRASGGRSPGWNLGNTSGFNNIEGISGRTRNLG